jgi:fructose-1,6-bisphosphatase I
MTDSISPPQAPSVVGTTLEAHILSGQRGAPGATGEFSSILNAITLGVRIIHTRVRAAGLAGMLGYTGETNVQGEEVQKLDAFANDVLCTALDRSGRCAMVASEELEQAKVLNGSGKYIVCFDPLDGSSNIDVNISIGTIFCILRAQSAGGRLLEGALQPGHRIVAAGYAVYGSATTLLLSTGYGVHGFTLDPNVGEFFLSHPNLRCPERGNTYSINEGNFTRWSDPVKRWNSWIKSDAKAPAPAPKSASGVANLPYGHRYVGSLVADAHRTLMKGGIFAYPADKKSPGGKLRLLYEANPMAYLFEQAGGAATNGVDRILDIEPKGLHDRTPLVLGSKHEVAIYRDFMTA